MTRFNWQILLGFSLLALSAIFYFIHYAIFRDTHHIFLYLVGDIAFVFIEVLLVTLIIHQLLSEREKRAMLKKLNMVIGAFLVRWERSCQSRSPALISIFERFYRGEKSRSREHGGASIELAIVKELIEAHDGHVGAKISDKETRVWFSIPA